MKSELKSSNMSRRKSTSIKDLIQSVELKLKPALTEKLPKKKVAMFHLNNLTEILSEK